MRTPRLIKAHYGVLRFRYGVHEAVYLTAIDLNQSLSHVCDVLGFDKNQVLASVSKTLNLSADILEALRRAD